VTNIVILGGGMVAGFAAQEMAEAGLGDARLTIVSADSEPPYHRPPLSKGLLAGEEEVDEILINEPGVYERHDIDLRLDTPIESVDLDGHRLTTDAGETISFDRLLIATGATPRRLDAPGADLDGIHTLRWLDDARAIRSAAASARRAVVVGGSFLGTEVASVLADQGLDTTLVYRGERLLERLFTPEMSRYTEEIFREHGATLVPSSEVVRFHPTGPGSSAVGSVELAGGERIDGDLVVLGLGVTPATELFAGSALRLDDGIVVDRQLAASVEGVWAAGDVARFPDPTDPSGEALRRVEHWDNAVEQGRLAGRNLLGEGLEFDRLPYFFSDTFDLSWELWGDPEAADEVVIRGRVETGKFGAWWLRDCRVVAVFLMDRPPEEREVAEALVRSGRRQSPAQIRDTGVALTVPDASSEAGA